MTATKRAKMPPQRKTPECVVIGIDPSYSRTGITVLVKYKGYFPELHIDSIQYKKDSPLTVKRNDTKQKLFYCMSTAYNINDYTKVIAVVEMPKVKYKKFTNERYLRRMGGMLAAITDFLYQFAIPVYTVPAVTWKTEIVGTSKPKNNRFGVNPNKFPTIEYVKRLGYLNKILIPYTGRGKKGVITINGKKYKFDDDAADSACIALYGLNHFDGSKMEKEL